jgi:anthranilate/para-aminobenzoate synthase component I
LFSGRKSVAVTADSIRLVPVMSERLADLETPVSAFAKLRALGGAFLFESAEGGERMGRYSFIGIAPRERGPSARGGPRRTRSRCCGPSLAATTATSFAGCRDSAEARSGS